MNYTDTLNLIQSSLTEYGVAVLAIITATIAIGLAYLVFKFGWLKTKQSLNSGVSNVSVDYGDSMTNRAMSRGRMMNKSDGLSF